MVGRMARCCSPPSLFSDGRSSWTQIGVTQIILLIFLSDQECRQLDNQQHLGVAIKSQFVLSRRGKMNRCGCFHIVQCGQRCKLKKKKQNKEKSGATVFTVLQLPFLCCPQELSIRDTQFKCRHSCHLTYRANVIQSIPSFSMLEGISSRSFHLSDEKAYSFVSPPSFLLVFPSPEASRGSVQSALQSRSNVSSFCLCGQQRLCGS